MADLDSIGNRVLLGLFAASLAVWVRVLWNGLLGRATLPLEAREGVSWPALPVCATFLVAFFLPALVVQTSGPLKDLSRAQQGCLVAVAQIATIVGLLACAGPLRAEDFGLNFSKWRTDLYAGAAGFLASLAPVFLLILIVENLGWRGTADKHPLLKLLDDSPGADVLGWLVLAAVVLAPLAEELLYRVLLQGWSQSQIAPAKAIVFSSIIFCLAHGTADVIPLVPLALILGYVYYRRRSYLAVVVLHALFNATMLTLAALTRGSP
jgi:membrane protease YdiL (CAAX protease family)